MFVDISGHVNSIEYVREPDEAEIFMSGLCDMSVELVGTWNPEQAIPLMYTIHMGGFTRLARKTKKAVKKWCLGHPLTRGEMRRMEALRTKWWAQ